MRPKLEDYLKKFENLNNNDYFLKLSNNSRKPNLSLPEKRALRNLRSNNNIIICQSDKNLGTVVLDKSWYQNSCFEHLNNKRDYKKIPNDIFYNELYPTLCNKVKSLLYKYLNKNNEFAKYIMKNNNNMKLPYFYIIPKIHKTPPSSRPISASQHWLFTPFSSLLAEILNPYVEKTRTYLKNSAHLVGQLIKFRKPHHISLLGTGDIESLYTNIPIPDLFQTISDIITKNKNDIEKKYGIEYEIIIKLTEMILINNYVGFNNEIYLQMHGIPMGTPCAPQLANLYLDMLEKKLPIDLIRLNLLWKRYIDDIIVIWSGDLETFSKFQTFYSNLAPTIKINWSINEKTAEFLDLKITKTEITLLPHSLVNKNDSIGGNSLNNNLINDQYIKDIYKTHYILEHMTHQKTLNNYKFLSSPITAEVL